jgi:hypothetical protein
MLTKRQLILSAAVLLAGLVFMNLLIVFLTRNSRPRQVMRHARQSQSASVVALGNSLVAAGFDEAAFDSGAGLSAPRGSANLGLGATTPVEHLLLLRYALSHGIRPHLVLYGFYDFQLTTPVQFTTSELFGNHAMLYYVEPLYARRFYSLPLHDAFQFRAMHSLPMFADRGAIWAKVEILRRAIAQQGMPAELSNSMGRAADFSLLEAADTNDFRRQCEAGLNLPLIPPVSELLRQAHDLGVTVAVVEMPMREQHRRIFYRTACWSQYTTHIRNLLAPFGAIYVDASGWIQDESLFDDPLHLSEGGAAQFSQRLGGVLASLSPQLAANSRETSMPERSRP